MELTAEQTAASNAVIAASDALDEAIKNAYEKGLRVAVMARPMPVTGKKMVTSKITITNVVAESEPGN